jgi:hypothetical protein
VPSLDEQLRRWTDAGLIDTAAVERILAFEKTSPAPKRERPGVVEVLVYLGVAVIAVGAAVLLGTQWDSLGRGGRIATLAVPGLLALAAGAVFLRTGHAALERGGQVAWLVAGWLLFFAAGIAFDGAGWDDRRTPLAASLVALPLFIVLWWFSRAHAQVLGLAAAAFVLSVSLGAQPRDFSGDAAWGPLVAFGLAGLVLAEAGVLRPHASASVLAAALFAIGAYAIGVQGGWQQVLVFAAAAMLVVLGVARGHFVYVAAGVVALFAGLVTTVVREVDDPTAVAFSLMVIGLLLVIGVAVLAKWAPWRLAHFRRPPPVARAS